MSSDKGNINIFLQEIENKMIKGILEYLNNGTFPNNNPNSFVNAYSIVQSIADLGDKESEQLFMYHNKILQDYIEDCNKIISKKPNSQLIDSFIKYTEKINFLTYWLNKIFTYLDRYYMKTTIKQSLSKVAIEIYINNLFNNYRTQIFEEVNKLLKEDRNLNFESRPKIKFILKVLQDIDFSKPKIVKENNNILWIQEEKGVKIDTSYEDEWFKLFKDNTIKFCKDKGSNDIHSMSATEYITAQLKYLEEEKFRQNQFINPKYHSRINDINYKYLIGENAQELGRMESGFPQMFTNNKIEELKNAFKLLNFFPKSLTVMTTAFQYYIKKRGEDISKNKEITKDPKKFIPELINLKKEMDYLVIECFDNHPLFKDNKNKAFSLFMTQDIYAKQLANYTDFCMKIGFKGKSQEEIENTLNDIIGLFKCLNSKLAFQIEANKRMSDRLIKNMTLSTNIEKNLITKLKQESGVAYVNKMMEMINDLEKNKNEMDAYKLSESKACLHEIKFIIQVISQSAWEINKKCMEKFELPKLLSSCMDDFEKFYISRHSNKKLIWCLGLSKLEIQFLYLKNKNISISTLPQYLLLLQLEKYETLSLEKIAEFLGCQISTVLTDIHGLVFNPSYNPQSLPEKGVILGSYDIKTKEFKSTDTVSINLNLNITRQKFNTIPLSVKKTAAEIRENELEEATINKKYQDNILQSTLTRIMKSRIGQETTHIWLVNETSKQIDLFKAQPQQIKENIEKLIEKNIIRRSEDNRTCYEYIA